jgi:hypothetical protein
MATGEANYSWFCTECQHGPQTTKLNPKCYNCGQTLDARQTVVHYKWTSEGIPEVQRQINTEDNLTEEGILEMPKLTRTSGDQLYSQSKSGDDDEDINFQEATALPGINMGHNKKIEQQVKESSANESGKEEIGQKGQKVEKRSAKENEKDQLLQVFGKSPTHHSASNLDSAIAMGTLSSAQPHVPF